MAFSFGNLRRGAGPKGARAEGDDKDEEKMEDEDENEEEDDDASAESESEDEQAEGDDKDEEAEGDTEDEQAAYARGVAKGRASERKRFGAVMSSDAVSAANSAFALHLLCNTDLDAKAIEDSIGAAPVASGGGLRERMSADPEIGAGSGGGKAKGPSAAALMKQRFGKE